MQALEIYASKVYKKDMIHLSSFFKDLKTPVLAEPKAPKGTIKVNIKDESGNDVQEFRMTEGEKLRYQEKLKRFFIQEKSLQSSLIGLYIVALGQCSKLMKNKLKSLEEFEDVNSKSDPARPLAQIKAMTKQYGSSVPSHDVKDIAKRNFYTYKQGEYDTVSTHVKNVKTLMEVLLHYDADVVDDDAIKEEKKLNSTLDDAEVLQAARNKVFGLAVIKTCKYPSVYEGVKKEYIYNNDVYPKDGTKAFEQFNHYLTTNKIKEVTRAKGPGPHQKGRKKIGDGDNGNTLLVYSIIRMIWNQAKMPKFLKALTIFYVKMKGITLAAVHCVKH